LAFAQKLWRLEAKIHFGEQRDFGRSSLPPTAVGMGDAQKRQIAKLWLKVRRTEISIAVGAAKVSSGVTLIL
jgi:hypothetical protein